MEFSVCWFNCGCWGLDLLLVDRSVLPLERLTREDARSKIGITLEARDGIEPSIMVLQTIALPLGYRALNLYPKSTTKTVPKLPFPRSR